MCDFEKINDLNVLIKAIADGANIAKKYIKDTCETTACIAAVKTCEEERGQPCVCGALVQCTSAIDKSETVHVIKYIKGNAVKVAEIEQLDDCDIFLAKEFSGCMLSHDGKCYLCHEENVIEGNAWQDIDTGVKQNPTGGALNVNWSYMICNFGPGVIYFKDSGQDFRTAMYREVVSQNFKFKYDWAKEGTVTPEFMERAAEISFKLGIDPDDLMAVIAFESRFDPKKQHSKGAYGLIQFTDICLEEMTNNTGTEYTKEMVKEMNAMEQLELVYLHYKPFVGKMHDIGDIYLVTLAPAHVDGSYLGDDTVLYTKDRNPKAYKYNKGLDWDDDGIITKGEAKMSIFKRRDEFQFED